MIDKIIDFFNKVFHKHLWELRVVATVRDLKGNGSYVKTYCCSKCSKCKKVTTAI